MYLKAFLRGFWTMCFDYRYSEKEDGKYTAEDVFAGQYDAHASE